MLKKLLLLLLLLSLGSGLSAWYGWKQYESFLRSPLDVTPGGLVFQLEPGSTGADIVTQLARLGLTRPGWKWRLLMRLEPHVYRAGEYRLEAGILPRETLRTLSSGQVMQYRVTLVEGWNFAQFAAVLSTNPVLEHEFDLAGPGQWSQVASELDISHPEGWFLPETYQFSRGDSDRDILMRAHAAMKQALAQAWESRMEDLPMDSPYQLLILASIIEKETSLDEERGRVAGVFTRRLHKGMRLQTDPTVIYGMGDSFDGDIRRSDLQRDTAYNTYTRSGLPPTPIAMPGRASLWAAANPAPGDELFFVANGEGGHTFSATLEAHQEAVRKLVKRN